ncbi:MAG: methyltransferase domain-containing protein [Deltaproteobacteria bacterium]|nr:methyltransferase domain-containing protein [Deltaproteobacteria bacterium]
MITSALCLVCGNPIFEELVDFGLIPRSNSLLSQPETSFPKVDHSLEFCPKCAMIRRRTSSQAPSDYSEVKRATGAQTPVYINEIIRDLTALCLTRGSLIIDVGGNDGAFLDLVASAGYTNRLNVEPAMAFIEPCRQAGHLVENVHLDLDQASRISRQYGLAEVIFCRHVLEHVPDPFCFLVAIRSMLKENGSFFLEIPDAEGIIHGLLGHELWDEHLFHFTADNANRLLIRAGWHIFWSTIKPHRGGTNLLVWAQPSSVDQATLSTSEIASQDVSACRSFKTRWTELTWRIIQDAKTWPRPIGCFGASHPQSNYLLFTGLGRQVEFLIDDDPGKIGRYVPIPQPVPVVSTAQLLAGPLPGTIIRSAFGCDFWMDKFCPSLSARGTLIVEPY